LFTLMGNYIGLLLFIKIKGFKLKYFMMISSYQIILKIVLTFFMLASLSFGKRIDTSYYRSGQIRSIVSYHYQDINDGPYTFFYKNGNVKHKGRYDALWKEGVHEWFFEDGTLSKRGTYKHNKKNGLIIKHHPNGKIKYEKHFKYGVQKKTAKYFFETGELKSEIGYVNGKKSGPYIYYYKTGSVKRTNNYVNGQRHGKAFSYHLSGNKSFEGDYQYGKSHGERIFNDRDGVLINGEFEIKTDSVVIRSGVCINGKPDGEILYFRDSGQLQIKANYILGLPNGEHTYFYESGKVKVIQYFKEGAFLREEKFEDEKMVEGK